MSLFLKAEDATPVKSRSSLIASLLLAAILVAMSMAQLYSFEDFILIVSGFLPYGASESAGVWAALLIVAQIGALPFLLSMRLSPAFRMLSMALGWLALLAWLVVSFRLSISSGQGMSGVLGSVIDLPSGLWMFYFFLGLLGLNLMANIGRWPQMQLKRPDGKE